MTYLIVGPPDTDEVEVEAILTQISHVKRKVWQTLAGIAQSMARHHKSPC